LSSRRVVPEDYISIAVVVVQTIELVRATVGKAIAKRLSDHAVMSYIIASENAWIVDDTYLVVYDVVTPWYAPKEIKDLREVLVLRLRPGSDFSRVPEFLAQRTAAEGASLAAVGTALARSDDALAVKYEQSGFRREAILLTRET
jgi:hypothetical protein